VFDQILILTASFLANAFSAFAGGGAGLLQLPLLIFLGLPFAAALATHKVATVFLGVGATLRHLREHTLDRHFILTMLLAGVPGVVIGANLILFIPDRSAEIALGILTMGLGVYSLLKPGLGQHTEALHRDRRGLVLGGLVLFIIGILNGSLTSGTGLFVTLWLIRWFGLEYKRAVAHTLVLVGLFWNGSGALTLGLQGIIYWPWLPALIAGSLLGGYVGAHWSIVKGNRLIKRAYELVTFAVGLLLILGRDRVLGLG
jgi:uncharacterized membrane protein YfcA